MMSLGWAMIGFGLGGAIGIAIGGWMRANAHADDVMARTATMNREHHEWHAAREQLRSERRRLGYAPSWTSSECWLCHLHDEGRTT